MIRVLTLDQHPLMRAGVDALLSAQPDIVPVGAADHERELWPLLSRTDPDVVLVGGSQPWDHPATVALLALCMRIKRRPLAPRVILHAGTGVPVAVAIALARADGIATTAGSTQQLVETIRTVAAGRAVLPPVGPRVQAAAAASLEPADLPILAMALAGTTPADIAATLGLGHAQLAGRICAMFACLVRSGGGGYLMAA